MAITHWGPLISFALTPCIHSDWSFKPLAPIFIIRNVKALCHLLCSFYSKTHYCIQLQRPFLVYKCSHHNTDYGSNSPENIQVEVLTDCILTLYYTIKCHSFIKITQLYVIVLLHYCIICCQIILYSIVLYEMLKCNQCFSQETKCWGSIYRIFKRHLCSKEL